MSAGADVRVLLIVERVVDFGDLPVFALFAQEHQHADFVFRTESNGHDRDVAKHNRLLGCDVAGPVLFVVVLHLGEIVAVTREFVVTVSIPKAVDRRLGYIGVDALVQQRISFFGLQLDVPGVERFGVGVRRRAISERALLEKQATNQQQYRHSEGK